MADNASLNRGPASTLGALTGLVGLIAMVRLIAGAGFTSVFAWAFLLAAMLPWIGYCIWRARHGNLRPKAALAVLILSAVGLVSVWLFTLGPVLALACSLVAFVIIWVHDWPKLRERRESTYVRVEELTAEQPIEEPADLPAEQHPGWPDEFFPAQAQAGPAEGPSERRSEGPLESPGELATDSPKNAA